MAFREPQCSHFESHETVIARSGSDDSSLEIRKVCKLVLGLYIDKISPTIYICRTLHSFPDCVMVALQILVLTVGVRILLGELKAEQKMFGFFYGSFEYRFSSSPSQGGETGSTPVGAKTMR